jgi:chorismate lyase / 3-hydroxybenzoate synthase
MTNMPGFNSSLQLTVSSLAAQSATDIAISSSPDDPCLAHVTFGLHRSTSPIQSVRQHVHAKHLLSTAQDHEELWLSKSPVSALQKHGVHCNYNNDLLFGVVEILESDIDAGLRPLEQAAQSAYRQLFEVLENYNYPYLWRAWNYIPDITGVADGLERYQQFNAGRQQGFSDAARSVTGNVPAACALGVQAGPLSVAFLAGRSPTIPIENPRQVSAYDYPKQYGLRSPTFSRASLAHLHQQELLFISGTASIVGHQTLHIGDVRNQTFETLQNLQAVLDQANLRSQGQASYRLQDLNLRVYVRHESDAKLIQSLVEQYIGARLQAIYINADICRKDLDVEIEGIAWQTIKPAVVIPTSL